MPPIALCAFAIRCARPSGQLSPARSKVPPRGRDERGSHVASARSSPRERITRALAGLVVDVVGRLPERHGLRRVDGVTLQRRGDVLDHSLAAVDRVTGALVAPLKGPVRADWFVAE
jgi:hypothetical protein